MAAVFEKELSDIRARLEGARAFLHIDEKQEMLAELEQRSAQPGFWDDVQQAQEVSRKASGLRSVVEEYLQAQDAYADALTAAELAAEDEDFLSEAAEAIKSLDGALDALEVESWFSGEYDSGDAIVTVNPGQGGLEAQDWTEMLFKMLTRYCDSKGWKVKVLDLVPGEGIGIDRAAFQVEGRNAYGMLRSENGVHRLVRISPTDAKHRRQTTFASVEVLPVLPEDVEVNLDPNDVRVDVYRSSGPGGQCVNTTDSAVRLTHIPTGIVVTCQNEKSQIQNRESAFRVLRSRLYELERQKREAQVDALRGDRMDNGFGSQIRSYVLYPYQMVKDLRSGVETGNVDGVLDGDLEAFVVGYHRWRLSQ